MIVGVTGSTGMIGMALCDYLRRHGHTAVAIFRNDTSFVVPQKLDAVVHLAGESIATGRWSEIKKTKIHDSRVLGTRNLVAVLKKLPSPPKVFLSASAVGIYGDRGEEELSESSPLGGDFLAGVAKDWEAEAQIEGIRCIQARFGIVLSPHGGALKKMLPLFKVGLGAVFGSGRQYLSWISLTDAVRALDHLLQSDAQGAYNITSPTPLTNKAFSEKLAALCLRKIRFTIPRYLIELFLGEASCVLLSSQRAFPVKLLASGFTFQDPEFITSLAAKD
jgi:uncharacterized protein (TIGR01777 family)